MRDRNRLTKAQLRDKLQGEHHITELYRIQTFLASHREDGLDTSQINAIRTEVDLHKYFLNKLLPDIRAIEQTVTVDVRKLEELSLDELNDIIDVTPTPTPIEHDPSPNEH